MPCTALQLCDWRRLSCDARRAHLTRNASDALRRVAGVIGASCATGSQQSTVYDDVAMRHVIMTLTARASSRPFPTHDLRPNNQQPQSQTNGCCENRPQQELPLVHDDPTLLQRSSPQQPCQTSCEGTSQCTDV